MNDLKIFSKENIHNQIKNAQYKNGYFVLNFYIDENNKFSKTSTSKIEKFYLYPTGGTLRDSSFNIVFYDSQFDTYRGFKIPGKE
ncbi:MAG: hypothetical protein AAB255_00065 [Bacteroidota bacterium]